MYIQSVRASVVPVRQRGATLVIALLILVLIMMIGITAISTSNTQYKLAGNLQFEDGAMNNAETSIAAAQQWLVAGTNYNNAGFVGPALLAATPQLKPIGYLATQTSPNNNPLSMTWSDTNSCAVGSSGSPCTGGNTAQRYFIELMSRNNRLQGSSQAVGGRTSSGCNQVNTYQITAKGLSARGATKFVQSFYAVLSCP
jgi:Tfp pilus assembly protein PilX